MKMCRAVGIQNRIDSLDDLAIDAVMNSLFKNYKTWCKFLGRKHSLRLPQGQQEIQQWKLLYMGLYLLIWGEASNVRFMAECVCYIFHNIIVLIKPIVSVKKLPITLIVSLGLPTHAIEILCLNLRRKRILVLIVVWVGFLLVQVIKNDVEACSAWYWVLFGLQFPIALLVFGYEAVKLYKEHKRRMSTGNSECM